MRSTSSSFREPYCRMARRAWALAWFAPALGFWALAMARAGRADVAASLSVLFVAIALGVAALFACAAAAEIVWRTGRRGAGRTLAAAVVAGGFLAWPGWLAARAFWFPAIVDVGTDTNDPPRFSPALAAARGGAVPAPPGLLTLQAQIDAYPDVQPILVELDMDESWRLARTAAQGLGWTLLAAQPPAPGAREATIEALAYTPVLRLPVDITVRLRPTEDQTRIDIRAVSRVGGHDFGFNAERIDAFAQAVQDQLDER